MSKIGRDYILFLEDIIHACEKIIKYTKELTFYEFSQNDLVIDAVIRNFEIIGEAANHIPNFIKEKYPEVEWREAIGFRNIMIHDYFGIDVESVWDTIQNNLSTLRKHVLEVLKAEYKMVRRNKGEK